jgi:hypothetical protein
LTNKELVAQSSCFVFSNGRICTFNEEVLCSTESPLGSITGAVTAKPLLDLLSRLPDDELEVETRVNEKASGKVYELYVRGKDRRSGVRMEPDVLLPVDSVEIPNEWLELDPEFCEALRVVHPCTSKDTEEFGLTCVHITPDFVEACDRFQIARYPVSCPITDDILIRGTSAAKIAPMAATALCATSSWLHFRNAAGVVISCRRFAEDYRDLGRHLDKADAVKITLPGGLEEVVSKAEVFSGENSIGDVLLIEIRKDEIRIKGEGASGWYQERKSVPYEGTEVSFYVKPSLLVAVSKKSNECFLAGKRLLIDGMKFSYMALTVLPEEMKPVESK